MKSTEDQWQRAEELRQFVELFEELDRKQEILRLKARAFNLKIETLLKEIQRIKADQ